MKWQSLQNQEVPDRETQGNDLNVWVDVPASIFIRIAVKGVIDRRAVLVRCSRRMVSMFTR